MKMSAPIEESDSKSYWNLLKRLTPDYFILDNYLEMESNII